VLVVGLFLFAALTLLLAAARPRLRPWIALILSAGFVLFVAVSHFAFGLPLNASVVGSVAWLIVLAFAFYFSSRGANG